MHNLRSYTMLSKFKCLSVELEQCHHSSTYNFLFSHTFLEIYSVFTVHPLKYVSIFIFWVSSMIERYFESGVVCLVPSQYHSKTYNVVSFTHKFLLSKFDYFQLTQSCLFMLFYIYILHIRCVSLCSLSLSLRILHLPIWSISTQANTYMIHTITHIDINTFNGWVKRKKKSWEKRKRSRKDVKEKILQPHKWDVILQFI